MPKLREHVLAYIAAAGLLGVLALSLGWLDVESNFAGLIYVDDYTTFFRVLLHRDVGRRRAAVGARSCSSSCATPASTTR